MPSQTVLLTGITGFIAKRIAFDLLAEGYHVRGSLRSLKRAEEVKEAITAQGGDVTNLSFVELDLTKDAGWADAMTGIDALVHTASPFPLAQPKDENDIIRPAVDGTMRALKAAQSAGVNRVVLTSSMVAVMYVDRPAGHQYTAADWTDIHHPAATAYVKSKTLAEKAAWDFINDHPDMTLTTVHPGLVLGTPMDQHYGTSLGVVERILSAKDPMQPDLALPIIDIEDVSALHVAALETPETAGHRLLATVDEWTFPQMAQVLADAYPNRKIKTATAPKWLLRVLALFDKDLKTVLPQIGFRAPTDVSETMTLTGMRYIPAKEAVLKSAAFIDAKG
ncbi:SDR family NAD(P)-dependent oxidoreductase [Shimia ponticola]|uniref:SDR family NAD(P)-dependent oxidoreductase n=1 Tax=Shimia ponticola TaxID=2582893 RepID=UPI0011BFB23D|nr:SDR family NAD(P)-dependent oxidoreductase [Shimia ponticola]